MDAHDQTRLFLKDEVYQIVGAAIEVLNEIGHGAELPEDHEIQGWRDPKL